MKFKLFYLKFQMSDDEFVIKNTKDEYDKRRQQDNVMMAKSIATAVTSIFNRQRQIDDPVLRSCLFVDKLGMALDVMTSVLQTVSNEDYFTEEVRLQVEKTCQIVQEELQHLMEYCRSPSYSPDAPFGKHLMDKVEKSYHNNSSQNDKNSRSDLRYSK